MLQVFSTSETGLVGGRECNLVTVAAVVIVVAGGLPGQVEKISPGVNGRDMHFFLPSTPVCT